MELLPIFKIFSSSSFTLGKEAAKKENWLRHVMWGFTDHLITWYLLSPILYQTSSNSSFNELIGNTTHTEPHFRPSQPLYQTICRKHSLRSQQSEQKLFCGMAQDGFCFIFSFSFLFRNISSGHWLRWCEASLWVRHRMLCSLPNITGLQPVWSAVVGYQHSWLRLLFIFFCNSAE